MPNYYLRNVECRGWANRGAALPMEMHSRLSLGVHLYSGLEAAKDSQDSEGQGAVPTAQARARPVL